MIKLLRGPVIVGIVLSILFAGAAYAQDSPPAVAPGQRGTGFLFNLGSTGARALGMGGTFIAFADDATAAEANPAGLPQLAEARVSANLQVLSADNSAAVDFSGGTATFSDRVISPSFVGYAQPFANGAFAVYYEQSKSRFHSDFEDGQTPISFIGMEFLVAEQLNIEYKVQTFGGSIAYSLGDYVAVGGSVRLSSLDWTQTRALTLTDFFEQPDSVTLDIDFQEVDSRDLIVNLGVLINPGGAFSGGFVYKQGAEFEIERRLTPSCSGITGELCNAANFTVDSHALVLPSTMGGGVKYAGESFRVGADLVQVTYSDLQDSFEFLFGFVTDEPIEDALQFHVGGEYGFGDPEEARGFIRAGAYSSPDHDGLRAIHTDGIHFAVGAGGVFSRTLQLDGAVDVANGVTAAIFSLEVLFR